MCDWVEIKDGVYECQHCGAIDVKLIKPKLRRAKPYRATTPPEAEQ